MMEDQNNVVTVTPLERFTSGVLIRGMKLPEDCDSCPFFDDYTDYPHCNANGLSRGYNWSPFGQRMPTCPLRYRSGTWADGHRPKSDGTEYDFRYCTACGYERPDCDTEKDTNYCPDCGAAMKNSEKIVNINE